MGRLTNDNDTEFELSSNKRESLIVDEPKNWNEDEKSYEVSEKGGGTLVKKNTSLEFRKDGYEYLLSLPLAFGYNSSATVTKRGKDVKSLGEKWRTLYRANLDLLSAKFLKNTVQVPFTQGGLYDRITARYTDTYDLVSTKSADNLDISELSTIKENNYGRDIYRRSTLKVDKDVQDKLTYSGGDVEAAVAVPFEIVLNSDAEFINGITEGANNVGRVSDNYANGSSGYMLYDRSNGQKTLVLNGSVGVRILDTRNGIMYLEEVYYKYNDTTDVYEHNNNRKNTLVQIDSGVNLNELTYTFNNREIELGEGESYALVVYVRVDNSGGDIGFEYFNTKLEIKLDDRYEQTESKAVLPFEFFDRIIEKITGEKGLLISKIFGRTDLGYNDDGEWSYLATTSGFWARGFDIDGQINNVDEEPIPLKQFNTSFNDAFESYGCVNPLYWGVITRNGKEYVQIEDYAFTQQDFIGIRLGRTVNNKFSYIPAQKHERTFLQDELFTKLEFGYEKGGNDYEEVIGLSSIHGKAEYNTSLNDTEQIIYTKVSKIRADVEGHELARIKQARLNPDEDTPYDQDLFFRHLKTDGNLYYLRTWQDDFLTEPIGGGVYSPETMGNLLLTPFRMLLRHKKIIGTGLHPDPYGMVTFISSNCFSSFVLGELKEDGAIENNKLLDPFISGFLLTFEGKVYQEMIDQIEGYTIVNGEMIPNWHGLYEVELNGDLVQGRLIKSSINGNGKHEIALIP